MTLTLVAALAAIGQAPPAAPKPAPPAEFRLVFQHFNVEKEPVARGEVIASRGRIYQLVKDDDEVIVIDPARRTAQFLDLKLNLASDLSLRDIDTRLAARRDDLRREALDLSRSRSRADRVEGEQRRDLVDPRFRVEYDPAARVVRLSNASAQVEARGESESDPARLAILVEALPDLARLRAYRNADNLRHLTEVDAMADLVASRRLRPVETTYLFRLAGPPEKYRWTFHLVPELGDRERQGLDLIESRLTRARHLPFDRYERRVDPGAP